MKEEKQNERKQNDEKQKKPNKTPVMTIILIALLAVGLAVMMYPVFSRWYNSHKQKNVIAGYNENVRDVTAEKYAHMLKQAREYNAKLLTLSSPLTQYGEVEGYDEILDISGTGIMGYITIPKINVNLPVYHGTSDAVLNVGAGHLQGSSFPVGGKGTHAIITAHRGLPSATLFSDLDKLVIGDRFTVTVLNETLAYEVDEIKVIKPEEFAEFVIAPDGDFVTLITCTPYGINTYRLFVRGHRVDGISDGMFVIPPDAVYIKYLHILSFFAIPGVIILMAYWAARDRRIDFPHYDPLSVLDNVPEKKA